MRIEKQKILIVFFCSFAWVSPALGGQCSSTEEREALNSAKKERDYIVQNFQHEDVSVFVDHFQQHLKSCNISLSSFGLGQGVLDYWKSEGKAARAKAEAAKVICLENTSKAALVVIDMQPFFVRRGGASKFPQNITKVDQITAKLLEAIKKARDHNVPIIFITYKGAGDINSQLTDSVKDYKNVKVFEKTEDGMFDSSNEGRADLVSYLKENKISKLIVTGANGGACVKESINGALDGNCNVIVYNKGVADFNYGDFIYPYEGYYNSLKYICKKCQLTEVSEISDVVQSMVENKKTTYSDQGEDAVQ